MSMPEEQVFTCPQCENEQVFVEWHSVNVTNDPEMKAKILFGELFKAKCNRCRFEGELKYPLLYHDMEQKLMIRFWPEGGQPDAEESELLEIMEGYRFRLVYTIKELQEKIRIYDACLDDRVIELLKFTLWREVLRKGPLSYANLYFGLVDDDEKKLIFAAFKDGVVGTTYAAVEVYDEYVKMYGADLDVLFKKYGCWRHVDAKLMMEDIITEEDIDAILKFLPSFESKRSWFGKWESCPTPDMIGPGKEISMPYVRYSKRADSFVQALCNNKWVFDFDWMKWEGEARKYEDSAEMIAGADLKTLRKLLTTHAKAERFCDGHLLSVYKSGHLLAILRRLKVLREEME